MLLENADAALYWAKRSGRGRTVRYVRGAVAPGGASSATRSRRCSRAARARSRIVFQPVVELATGRAGGYEALTRIRQRAAPRAGRVVRAGAPRRPRGRSSRRSPCAPRSPSQAAPTAPSSRSTSRRARCSPRRCGPRCPQDLTGIVDRAHRARAVRRRGRARDRAGRAARPRRAGRARRRRRGLRGPAADHPDRARHPQARPRARPRRARRRLAPGAAGGADRLRGDAPAPRSAPRASRISTTCARSSRSTSPTRRATASPAPGPPWPAPHAGGDRGGRGRDPRRPARRDSPRAASRAPSPAGWPSSPTSWPRPRRSPISAPPTCAPPALLRADDVALMLVDRGDELELISRNHSTPSARAGRSTTSPPPATCSSTAFPGQVVVGDEAGDPAELAELDALGMGTRPDRARRLRRPRARACSRSTACGRRPSPPARSTAPACSPSSSARRSTACLA